VAVATIVLMSAISRVAPTCWLTLFILPAVPAFGIVCTDGQMLVIYHAEGPFEEVLARLGTLDTDGT
jgi:hypothetical protein